MDHFGYKAPDFSFIHESIWYDLGRFENWLIDCRGLNLGDVVPFRSCRLPGPTFPVSDASQTSASEEEEPFISAFSTASKAASLPKNLNGSEWEPSSSKATAGGNLAISSIERLDGIESFLTPLTEEVVEKAHALLKAREDVFSFTPVSGSIQSWLQKTTSDPPSSTAEVYHPLASLPHAVLSGETLSPVKVLVEELPARKIKEEPLSQESGQSAPMSADFAEPQPKDVPLCIGKQAKASSSPGRPQPIGAVAPTAAPQKSKSKIRGLSILHSALEVPLEVKLLAGSKKPKATSTPQSLMVRYNPRSCHLGGLPTGSIEMKELKDSTASPIKEKESLL